MNENNSTAEPISFLAAIAGFIKRIIAGLGGQNEDNWVLTPPNPKAGVHDWWTAIHRKIRIVFRVISADNEILLTAAEVVSYIDKGCASPTIGISEVVIKDGRITFDVLKKEGVVVHSVCHSLLQRIIRDRRAEMDAEAEERNLTEIVLHAFGPEE